MSNQTNSFVLMENSESIMLKVFLKKAARHATLSFLLCTDRCEMINVQPLLLFITSNSCLFSLCMLIQISLTKEDIPLHIPFSKLVHREGKITSV